MNRWEPGNSDVLLRKESRTHALNDRSHWTSRKNGLGRIELFRINKVESI
jgi:hypothetical protein